MKAEKTRKMIDGLKSAFHVTAEDFIFEELSELETKTAKWDDPQTQADLELAAAVRKAFEVHGGIYLWEQVIGDRIIASETEIDTPEDLVNWYREQLRGETNG